MSPVQRVAAAIAAATVLVLPALASAAPTDLDGSFGSGGVRTTALTGSAVLADVVTDGAGRIVAAGREYDEGNGIWTWKVARYSADGAPDASFAGGVLDQAGTGLYGGAEAVAVDAADAVYTTGELTGSDVQVLVNKVDASGSPSPTFNGSLPIMGSTRTTGRGLALLADGGVVVAGDAMIGPDLVGFVARFTAAGEPDSSFDGDGLLLLPGSACAAPCGVAGLALSGTDAYVAATTGTAYTGRVFRVTASGFDAGYGTAVGGGAQLETAGMTSVGDLAIADGKVVVGGSLLSACGVTRLTADGAIDLGYGTNGAGRIALGNECWVTDVAIDASGRPTFTGGTWDGTATSAALGRFTATGNPDSTFVAGGAAVVRPGGAESGVSALAFQGEKILTAGFSGEFPHDLALARFQGGVIVVGGGGSDSGSGSGSGSTGTTSPPAATPPAPKDTTPPRLTITYPAENGRTTDATPRVSGRTGGAPGDQDSVIVEYHRTLNSGKVTAAQFAQGPRTGRYWEVQLSRIPDGVWTVTATLADAAGNSTTTPARKFRVGKLPTPTNAGRFTVTGNPEPGDVVGVRQTADWTPATDLDVRYRWQRCDDRGCDWVSAQSDSPLYRVRSADRSGRLRATIYASNPDRKAPPKQTTLSAMVPPPDQIPYIANRSFPRPVGDDISVGDVVRAYAGDWRGTPSNIAYTYRWQVCRWEVWCDDVGRGSTYRIQPADQGHKLNLIVYASNRAGSNYAWSGTGRAIEADRASRRRAIVVDSYIRVFGRDPRKDELAYWQPRSEDLAALIRNHQQFIRDNRWMAEEVTRRAWEKVYGHGPYTTETESLANQTAQFNQDVGRVWGAGTTYDDLVTRLARELANQALQRIFFWRDQVSNRSLVEAHVRNLDTSMFVDRVRRDVYKNGGSTRGENLWTDVALSNEPLHGSARTEYTGLTDGAATRENCYGAVGPGCTGVPGQSFAYEADPFVTLDGRKMSYLQVTTAVGSITHDAMCRVYPWTSYLKFNNGGWCGDAALDPTEALPIAKLWVTGAAEWNKATGNTLQGRKWFEIYGPYPAPDTKYAMKSKKARTYSDDLRPAETQKRYTELTRGGWILGIADFDKPFKWQGKEIRGSLRLEAPAGTTLDSSDEDFCRNGFAYRTPGRVPGQRNYNICA